MDIAYQHCLPEEIWLSILEFTESIQDFHSLCSTHRPLYHAFHSIKQVVPLIIRIARLGRMVPTSSSPLSTFPERALEMDTDAVSISSGTSVLPEIVSDSQTALAIICLKNPWPQGPSFEASLADYFLSKLDQYNIPAKRALALAAVRCHKPILRLFASRPAFVHPMRVILYQAAMQGELETVSAILQVWLEMGEVSTVVYAVSQFGDFEALRFMLGQGAWSGDALALAAIERFDDIVNLFLSYIPPSLQSEEDKNHVLLIACQFGNVEYCRRLIEIGADMRCDNDLPLLIASRSGHVDLVRQFLAVFRPDETTIRMILYLAASSRRQDIVQLIFENGLAPQDVDRNQLLNGADDAAERSLVVAARKPSSHTLQSLLDQGANPHASHGQVLVEAARHGSVDSVNVLLQAGVDPSTQDDAALIAACVRVTGMKDEFFPLDCPPSPTAGTSIDAFDGLQIVRLLLKHGASPMAREGMPLKMAEHPERVGVCQVALVRALHNSQRMAVGMEDMEASAQYEDELMEFQMERYGR
ncbi:hypothetical protein HDU97_003301 [Phlyctochytrium planicorne]|nr:hypothetical protein HDU97_003301 [Phlyctochytrium planicorne]